MKLQPWKDVTDTSECYKVFQVVKGYSTGVYTKDEFKSKLKSIDLSNLENFREHIKAIIKDALKEDKSIKKASVETEEIKATENVVKKKSYKVEE
jgi:pyruvate dehydrogenase complex dehydrogenase (E1) component